MASRTVPFPVVAPIAQWCRAQTLVARAPYVPTVPINDRLG